MLPVIPIDLRPVKFHTLPKLKSGDPLITVGFR